MKLLEDFKKSIAPKIEELEGYRLEKNQDFANKTKGLLFALVVFFFVVSLYSYLSSQFFGIFFCLFCVVSVYYISRAKIRESHETEYTKRFKMDVLKVFVKALDPNLLFQAFRQVPLADFRYSNLYRVDSGLYSGEDYFEGKTKNGASFYFSEILARFGQGENIALSLKGLFFVLDCPQATQSTVVVKFEKTDPRMKDSKNSTFNGLREIFIEQKIPWLKNVCKVYCNDVNECYEVITPTMAEAIFEFRKLWRNDFRLAFKRGKLYIGVSSNKDLFIGDMFVSTQDPQFLERIYGELSQCFDVVEIFSKASETIGVEAHPFIDLEDETKNDDNLYDHLLNFND